MCPASPCLGAQDLHLHPLVGRLSGVLVERTLEGEAFGVREHHGFVLLELLVHRLLIQGVDPRV